MTDNIRPDHYRKGEIDLFEEWYLTYPFDQYRAIMQSHAEKYLRRVKSDRAEDLGKAIYCLEVLREKEIEHDNSCEEISTKDGTVFIKSESSHNQKDDENIRLLNSLLDSGYNYLARDGNGDLWTYQSIPKRNISFWNESTFTDKIYNINGNNFPEVKWTDGEPTKIANLLATYENGGENGK